MRRVGTTENGAGMWGVGASSDYHLNCGGLFVSFCLVFLTLMKYGGFYSKDDMYSSCRIQDFR